MQIHDSIQHASDRDVTRFDSTKLTRQGAWQLCLDKGLLPAEVSSSSEPFVKYAQAVDSRGVKRKRNYEESDLSRQHIFAVHIKDIYRETCITDED